jgi:RHS repeat-associated protein
MSPFNSTSYGSSNTFLQQVNSCDGLNHQFSYNTSGELTQVQLPRLGKFGYDYATATYSSGVKYREVQTRKLYQTIISSAYTSVTFVHESSPPALHHQWTRIDMTQLNDPGGIGRKYWVFGQSGTSDGLVTKYEGIHVTPVTFTTTTKARTDYTWSLDPAGKNRYISSALKTIDPGQSYQVQSKTEQTIDNSGNVTQVKTYDYGNLTTPLRTDNFTYNSANRLLTAPNVSIQYTTCCTGDASAYPLWDQTMQNGTLAVLPTSITTLDGTTTIAYGPAGQQSRHTNNGLTSYVYLDPAHAYAVPASLSVGNTSNFDVDISYNNQFLPTSTTTANGATSSTTFDNAGRPTASTSPIGTVTNYTYAANYTVTSTPGFYSGQGYSQPLWTKSTLDGLGRPILVESGYGSSNNATLVNQAETQYDACACTPIGKVRRTALPHAPGTSPVWTEYSYDGLGRTLTSVTVGTDTVSTTTYTYEGNTVKITDAAGKWKKYTSNVLGQLTQVNEPNPAGGADYVTNYTYDSLGHLTNVSMPRPTGTQTRTFTYTGNDLVSATNPESGTVTYAYNSDKTLLWKTDAKGQRLEYIYDAYKRVTQINRFTAGPPWTTAPEGNVVLTYDTNPHDTAFSENPKGRLTTVTYTGARRSSGNDTVREMYSYSPSGITQKKRMRVERPGATALDLDTTYGYNSRGQLWSIQYPGSWNAQGTFTPGPTYTNEFDEMGRLKKLINATTQTDVVASATYNAMGELLQMVGGSGGAPTETRAYNSIGQLKQLTSGSGVNLQYNFSASQNNGKIVSETDVLSGETVAYTYDSLNRLASATSSTPAWGQSFGYDGFGNLTNVNVTKGTAPMLTQAYNPATNRRYSDVADANGNLYQNGVVSYDVENRVSEANGVKYAYSPDNLRIWRGSTSIDELTVYSMGQKLGAYNLSVNNGALVATCTGYYEYFGGKMIKNADGYVNRDRLGSIGKFFPYGQERTATANGTEKFATYTRDAETGLDYAQNRYHSSGDGRFLSPDPYYGSANVVDPGSLNRYPYVGGDPVNYNDPSGLIWTCFYVMNVLDSCEDDGRDGTITELCRSNPFACLPHCFYQGNCPDTSGGGGGGTTTTTLPTTPLATNGGVNAKEDPPTFDWAASIRPMTRSGSSTELLCLVPMPCANQPVDVPLNPFAVAIFQMVTYSIESISFQVSATAAPVSNRTVGISFNTDTGFGASVGTNVQPFGNGTPQLQPRVNPLTGTVGVQLSTPVHSVPKLGPFGWFLSADPYCGVFGFGLGVPGAISFSTALNFGGC